jgi:poly-gamma-glutamate synthesis protein (capsule biosynthesis protein)
MKAWKIARGAYSSLLARAALLLVSAYYLSMTSILGATPDTWGKPFPAQFHDSAVFSTAIADAAKKSVTPRALSGISVPHHLVAADLIALAFQMVDANKIDTVVLLFPDHFKRSKLAFATSARAFDTVFGRIDVSQSDVQLLLQSSSLVGESDLFESDHGIGAILPFIRHYIPSARIVPVAVSLRSSKKDWDALAAILKGTLRPNTLVVQSADFSHYLPLHEALQRDQEVLNILAAGDIESVARLRQPSHTDSRGSQYLQIRLQHDVFRAQPAVLANSNSQAYADQPSAKTTSYVVQLYEPKPAARVDRDWPGSKVYCFAGDSFFGRGVLRTLGGTHGEAQRVQHEMQRVLNGCRLVVNLTGVMVPDLPINLDPLTLAMPAVLTLEWLRALNVVAVSLANNHTMDLGGAAFDAMTQILTGAGFAVLKHGSVVDLGPFRLAALTDLDNRTRRGEGVIEEGDIDRLGKSTARPPLFAMVNWGLDHEATPRRRQLALQQALHEAAVSLIVGVHPHVTAREFQILGGGQTLSIHSLGNFLFDQGSPGASGSVLEVRVFDQGTFFARLVPIPNFIEGAIKGRSPD